MSKLAGVSHDTYDKGHKILNSDNEEVKQKVLSGDMSINEGRTKFRPFVLYSKYSFIGKIKAAIIRCKTYRYKRGIKIPLSSDRGKVSCLNILCLKYSLTILSR